MTLERNLKTWWEKDKMLVTILSKKKETLTFELPLICPLQMLIIRRGLKQDKGLLICFVLQVVHTTA